MPTWKWIVNGKEVFGDGVTEQDAWDNYRSARRVLDPTAPGAPRDRPEELQKGDPWEGFLGLIQGGLLDPAEGLAQLAEHAITSATGKKPHASTVKKALKDFRDRIQSSYWGAGGEIAGNIAGGLAGGAGAIGTVGRIAQSGRIAGVGRVAGDLARGAVKFGAEHPIAARAATGIAGGGIAAGAQPEIDEDSPFWREKANQALLGATLGGVIRPLSGALANAPIPQHFSFTHLVPSVLGQIAQPLGRIAGKALPPGSIGEVAANIYERSPLSITVHPDSPIAPAVQPPESIQEPPDDIIQP